MAIYNIEQINIQQISIPELLSEEKPLNLLEKILQSTSSTKLKAKAIPNLTFLLMDEVTNSLIDNLVCFIFYQSIYYN